MDTSRVLDKIKKCLALAQSSNPHEAAAAMRQAQALMRQYGVDDEALLASEATAARMKTSSLKRPSVWECNLASAVAAAFNVSLLFRVGVHRVMAPGYWEFIGCGPAPEVATYAFQVLVRLARKARAHYTEAHLARCKPAAKVRRADLFSLGWVAEVRKHVATFAQSPQQQAAIDAYLSVHCPSRAELVPTDRHKNLGERTLKPHEVKDIAHGLTAAKDVRLNHAVGNADALRKIAHNL
ncbi:MAG: DUF2786 domain-containing protein [Candidatus Nanopelagicales bacterium]